MVARNELFLGRINDIPDELGLQINITPKGGIVRNAKMLQFLILIPPDPCLVYLWEETAE
jgi:hypothetical protein